MDLKKRILVIDDEKDLCEILKTRLQSYGFEVSLAYRVHDGFQKILTESPDCVILDIKFPEGEDGLTLLRRIRLHRDPTPSVEDRFRKLPVIVLTGTGDGMKSLFQLEGISDFIEKPFDSKDLKARILKAITPK